MKKFQQLCAAIALTMALALSAFAGDMSCPGITNPPPDPQQTSATGDIQLPGATFAGEMGTPLASDADSVAEIALTLMVNVLSVF